jgi:hypothetical protein
MSATPEVRDKAGLVKTTYRRSFAIHPPNKAGQKPKNWNNTRADKEEKAQKLLEERYRESHANKLLADKLKNPNGAALAQDEKGLDMAYGNKGALPGAYLDRNTHTLYVKGTVDGQDWWDDFTKVPFWGDLKDSRRHKEANAAYKYYTEHGEAIDRTVGHSLGGSVALELQKNKSIDYSRTFGAPVLDLNPLHRGTVERYRHPLDPVSILDRGAHWGPLRAYPHTYTGFGGLAA